MSSLAGLQTRTLGNYRYALTTKAHVITNSSNTLFRTYERRVAHARAALSNKSAELSAIFIRLARRVRDTNNALLRATGILRSSINARHRYLDQLPGKLRQYSLSSVRNARRTMNGNYALVVKRQATAIKGASHMLAVVERAIATNDPKRNMRLGYSLSYSNGRLLRNAADLTMGEIVTTQLADGEFTSEVKGIK